MAINLERELKSGWRIVVGLFRIAIWIAATVWLGAKALWQLGCLVLRWRAIVAQTLRCPRGHVVPMYGIFECRCGALHEGWVFGRCRICGASAGWTPCPKCKLPVRSPLL